jgi:hypothetical protein
MKLLFRYSSAIPLILLLMSTVSVPVMGVMADPRVGTAEQPAAAPQKSDTELSIEMSSPKVTAPVVQNMEESSRSIEAPEIPTGPNPDSLLLTESNSHTSKKSSHKEKKGGHSLIFGLAITGVILGLGFGAGLILIKYGPKSSKSTEIENDEVYAGDVYDENDGRLIIE